MIEALGEIANWLRGKRLSLGEQARQDQRVERLAAEMSDDELGC
jgi:hypothetical protein